MDIIPFAGDWDCGFVVRSGCFNVCVKVNYSFPVASISFSEMIHATTHEAYKMSDILVTAARLGAEFVSLIKEESNISKETILKVHHNICKKRGI